MHVLLIGIDDYSSGVPPLNGCVNDIDSIQRLLVDRLGVARDRIKRFVSPREGTSHETDVESAPATRENLVRALGALGSDTIGPDDKVFIYYSGHGSSVVVEDRGTMTAREGLVPVDASVDGQGVPHQLLLDIEINRLLGRIAERTQQVTIILDCCHSAGATRAAFDAPGDATRALRIDKPVSASALASLASPASVSVVAATPGVVGGLRSTVDDCQVVAACLADEKALECDDDQGRKHGLLTQKLVTRLASFDPKELPDLVWGRIWRQVVADMGEKRPQHATLIGSYARPVFGGPPRPGDTGYGVKREGDVYTLDVGELSGLGQGACVAVYGSTPASFPPLDSDEDQKARAGLLRVTQSMRSFSLSVAEGTPFALPEGARARLVEAGAAARIAVGLKPQDALDPLGVVLAKQIGQARRVRLADASERPSVNLVRRTDGDWALTDAVHGTGEKPGEPYLVVLGASQVDRAGALLDHYARYSEPLRMAELCTDLPGALQLSLLDCNGPALDEENRLTGIDPQAPDLPELQPGTGGVYERCVEDRVCFRIKNTSGTRLKLTLLDCAPEGYVGWLGEEVLEANRSHVFWIDSQLGVPFWLSLPEGRSRALDRIVAIGTTAVEKSLGYLKMDPETETFAHVLAATRALGGPPSRYAVTEKWTAVRMTLQISAK